MKELKICKRAKNRFTVVERVEDYDAFPYDGTFPDIYYYYRVDTEEELLALIQSEELFVDTIETIYYGNLDVTDKYIKFN